MTLALIGFGLATVLELLLWLRLFWRIRSFLAVFAIGSLGLGSVALVAIHPSLWTAAILCISGYRTINMLRIIKGRTMADYLYIVARGTTLWLVLAQAVILGGAWLSGRLPITSAQWWHILVAGEFAASLILLGSTLRNQRTTQPPDVSGGIADKDLPSLTVAIPARNETEALSACLESLIASSYPKLEILVLDDCSQNKRTPQIIRSFAHAGVRFIAGQSAPDYWLAKNFAYEQLFNQSNGELILFCGVDAVFEPDSLRHIVQTMFLKKKTMCSIIPVNVVPKGGIFQTLLQPSRYAWELSLPRRVFGKPSLLSTCWIVSREHIKKNGSFKAVTRSILPEVYFARAAAEQRDGYSFMQSSTTFGVSTCKAFDEQRATAIRTRYPQLHRRPELACLLSLSVLLTLIVPYMLLVASFFEQQWILFIGALACVIFLTIFYIVILQLTYRRFLWRSLFLLPLAAGYDIVMLNYSMWMYEFSDVLWKGRNVCIPVMHVIPSLPKLP
jgi:glycosyltransferase involved in cell wall biosynthesis